MLMRRALSRSKHLIRPCSNCLTPLRDDRGAQNPLGIRCCQWPWPFQGSNAWARVLIWFSPAAFPRIRRGVQMSTGSAFGMVCLHLRVNEDLHSAQKLGALPWCGTIPGEAFRQGESTSHWDRNYSLKLMDRLWMDLSLQISLLINSRPAASRLVCVCDVSLGWGIKVAGCR